MIDWRFFKTKAFRLVTVVLAIGLVGLAVGMDQRFFQGLSRVLKPKKCRDAMEMGLRDAKKHEASRLL